MRSPPFHLTIIHLQVTGYIASERIGHLPAFCLIRGGFALSRKRPAGNGQNLIAGMGTAYVEDHGSAAKLNLKIRGFHKDTLAENTNPDNMISCYNIILESEEGCSGGKNLAHEATVCSRR
jgi:hypothetical protein